MHLLIIIVAGILIAGFFLNHPGALGRFYDRNGHYQGSTTRR